jgi:4-hydroxy-tetrahydrodipicolinate synthase
MVVKNIEGMIPPVVVPFDEKEHIDREAFRAEVRYLFGTGTDGISSGGSTGEGAILSDEELRICLEIVLEENKRKIPVVAGVIRNSTREVVKAALDAKAIGADALLITPVFYYSATLEGNYEFFKEIGKKVGLPIIIYNVVPTNLISARALKKLSEIDEIIGIKQVDPVVLAEMVSVLGGRMKVYGACDELLYGSYVSGASGAISALVTVAPRLCVDQWRAFKSGDQTKAMEIHKKIFPLVKCYSEKPFPGKVKELLNLQGRNVGKARRPILEPTAAEKKHMKTSLKKAGLI